MPPPPKKKAMPTAPKTPPKKPVEKLKTPAKDVSKASSSSEAPKAPEHVPKAIGKELPKTPPKMAPKTPSAANRSVSPTLVDAATAPTGPKPSGVDRAKDSSPTRPPEGLPEQVPMPTTPSEAFRAARDDEPAKASSLAATSPAQSVVGHGSPKASPKPPPPPLDSPPAAHQEPPPPPTEMGFPVTGPAELPKSPMVAPVFAEVFTGKAVHRLGSTSVGRIADRFNQRHHKDHGNGIPTHFDTNGPYWQFSSQFKDIQTSSMLHRMPWYWSVDS